MAPISFPLASRIRSKLSFLTSTRATVGDLSGWSLLSSLDGEAASPASGSSSELPAKAPAARGGALPGEVRPFAFAGGVRPFAFAIKAGAVDASPPKPLSGLEL
eukprot:scaffold846_cov252-Pinguiococcus_pyrenoidosus.AAC.29